MESYWIGSIVGIVLSFIAYQRGHFKLSILLLTALGFYLRYVLIDLNDFLYLWDEQYHALVAKNMLADPLSPTLYKNPLLDYDYRSWTSNHIWLHKQPFFLWLIAGSIKIFGLSSFSVKLPSLVLSTMLIPVCARIGELASSKMVAYGTALTIAIAAVFIETPTGLVSTDHNDVVFVTLNAMALWALFEWLKSEKIIYIFLIGLLSGAAVLTKWLPGLIVFAPWGTLALIKLKKGTLKEFKFLAISLGICLAFSYHGNFTLTAHSQ